MSRNRAISLVICLAAAAFFVEAAVSGSLKEKIVFVRADPSLAVASNQSITDVGLTGGSNGYGGATGTHDAPGMIATSTVNRKGSEIAIMNPDGSGVVRLKVAGTDPTVSPDGTKIAYCSTRDTIYYQIYVMNSDGTGPKKITDFKTGDACGPVWSHDGKKIAFYAYAMTNPSRNPEIWVMDPDGSNQKKLTDHGMDPSWAPNDKQIAFASNREGNIFHIFSMNADGSNVKKLSKSKGEDSNPAWGPSGGEIAYSSETDGDRRGIFTMGADGSEPARLAFSKHQDFCFPAWSLDGKVIAFTVLNRLGTQQIITGEEKPRCEVWTGEYQLFAMDSDGKTHQLADTKVSAMRPVYARIAGQ